MSVTTAHAPGGEDMGTRCQPGVLEELLRRLDSWPYLRAELRGDRVTLVCATATCS
jgi:hypothetical protein